MRCLVKLNIMNGCNNILFTSLGNMQFPPKIRNFKLKKL
jgi:hypothetical protein